MHFLSCHHSLSVSYEDLHFFFFSFSLLLLVCFLFVQSIVSLFDSSKCILFPVGAPEENGAFRDDEDMNMDEDDGAEGGESEEEDEMDAEEPEEVNGVGMVQ